MPSLFYYLFNSREWPDTCRLHVHVYKVTVCQSTLFPAVLVAVVFHPSHPCHSQSSLSAVLVAVSPPFQLSLLQSALPPSHCCRSVTGVFVAVSPPFQPSATAWNAAGTWMCWLHHHHLIARKLYLFVLSSNWVHTVECMGEMPDIH